jgi:hypothetical protein
LFGAVGVMFEADRLSHYVQEFAGWGKVHNRVH